MTLNKNDKDRQMEDSDEAFYAMLTGMGFPHEEIEGLRRADADLKNTVAYNKKLNKIGLVLLLLFFIALIIALCVKGF